MKQDSPGNGNRGNDNMGNNSRSNSISSKNMNQSPPKPGEFIQKSLNQSSNNQIPQNQIPFGQSTQNTDSYSNTGLRSQSPFKQVIQNVGSGSNSGPRFPPSSSSKNDKDTRSFAERKAAFQNMQNQKAGLSTGLIKMIPSATNSTKIIKKPLCCDMDTFLFTGTGKFYF